MIISHKTGRINTDTITKMPIGILKLTIYLPGAHSLKDKRHYIKPLANQLRSKFNLSVAEVGDLDHWQTSYLLIAVVSNEAVYVEQILTAVIQMAEGALRDGYITKRDWEIITE
jgi:uncharacterized protein